jgi:cobalamin biosynthesis protein CobC
MEDPFVFARLAHGGDLGAARKLFPDAPQPFLDLSTGINPHSYPIAQLSSDAFTRLPQADAVARLAEVAAVTYGAPHADNVAVAPSSQILMALVAGLVPGGRAAVLGPTYGEHARVARLAGHDVAEVADIAALEDAALAIVVNPNSPDGRVVSRNGLLDLAARLQRRRGLLVVDEAFMDVGPEGESLCDQVERMNVIVLRSFGKFYGLPGLRLSFALAETNIAKRLNAALGPWPVSGAALAVGTTALADTGWRRKTRMRLDEAMSRLDELLEGAGLAVVGGTSLFRLARADDAERVFAILGRTGILVRCFPEQKTWLRFGLPGDEGEWQRLAAGLAALKDQ